MKKARDKFHTQSLKEMEGGELDTSLEARLS
jgi:hypothetical protein